MTNNAKSPGEESLPTDLEGVTRALKEAEEAENLCRETIKTLMSQEDLPRGINHAAKIHTLKQEGATLKFTREFLKSRLARLHDEANGSGDTPCEAATPQ